ncbi:MAG: hypothetical protein AAGI44_13300, partial [Pseudomonadota bacterium]
MHLLLKQPQISLFKTRSALTAIAVAAVVSSATQSEEAEQNTYTAGGSIDTLEHIIVQGEKIERSYL